MKTKYTKEELKKEARKSGVEIQVRVPVNDDSAIWTKVYKNDFIRSLDEFLSYGTDIGAERDGNALYVDGYGISG